MTARARPSTPGPADGTLVGMCRSIKTLRPPYIDDVSPEDTRAAALQYVRKIAGMRAPAAHNAAAFEAAVATVTAATDELLAALVLRGTPGPTQTHRHADGTVHTHEPA